MVYDSTVQITTLKKKRKTIRYSYDGNKKEMTKQRTSACPLWILCCIFLTSILSTYFGLAHNISDGENKKATSEHNNTATTTAKNDNTPKPSSTKEASVKTVLVEVADQQQDDDDDDGDGGGEYDTFRFTPSIAPATPQVLLVSPSMEVFIQSSTHGIQPSASVDFLSSKSSTIGDQVVEEVDIMAENNVRETKEENIFEQTENTEPLSPAIDFLPTHRAIVMEDEKDSKVSNDDVAEKPIKILEDYVGKNTESIDIASDKTNDQKTREPAPRTTPTPVSHQENHNNKEVKIDEIHVSTDQVEANDSAEKESIPVDEKGKDKGMLSFTEWKKKLDEQAKELDREDEDIVDVSKLVTPKNKTITKKKTNKIKKNYASLECGAKVIAANPEASNSLALLKEDKDIYMLNPCNVKAWFVVELCERIEVHSIDFANYEMFSSTPEEFVVYASSRYPSREWEVMGTFQGKPEKTTHNYQFDDRFYAKYLKLEVTKYFGKEHYCPLSLLRVHGLTEVEQIENEEDSEHTHDENHDESHVNDKNTDEKTDNIFTTAKNAVVDLVSDMANKLSGKTAETVNNNDTNSEEQSDNKTIDNDIVTLLPNNMTHSDDYNEDYMNAYIQRTTEVLKRYYNVSANPACMFWFDLMFREMKCSTNNMTRRKFRPRRRRETSHKRKNLTDINVKTIEKKLKNLTVEEVIDDVPPLPIPPIDLSNSEKNEDKLSAYPHSSENTVKQDGGKITHPDISESKQSDEHKVATTSEQETPTCSKIDPPTIDVRKILQPTLQPSFHADTTLSTTSETAESTKSLHTEATTKIETGVKQPLLVEATSTSSKTLTPTTSSSLVVNSKQPLAEKDVMEFKVDTNSNEGKMVAETVLNNIPEDSVSSILESSSQSEVPTITDNTKAPSESISVTVDNLKVIESVSVHPTPTATMATILNSESIALLRPVPIDLSSTLKETPSVIHVEATSTETASEAMASSSAVLTATAGLSGSKESIIVKLNAKVKALQANLTMSMMYLEEMSERYRTAVEEVDKRHEMKNLALNLSMKIQQDLISHQTALIANMTKQIQQLSADLKNLTHVTQEQNLRLTERHYSWVFIEVFVLFFILLFCRRSSSKERHVETTTQRQTTSDSRRHSEPIITSTPLNGHPGSPNGLLKRARRALSDSDSPIHRAQPTRRAVIETLSNGQIFEDSVTTGPTKKKKRKKSKGNLLDNKPNNSLEQASQVKTPPHETIEKRTGILFTAGSMVLSGLTGAFYKSPKATSEKPSRQADALIDNVTRTPTGNAYNKGLRKAKSIDLPTIDEVDSTPVSRQHHGKKILDVEYKGNGGGGYKKHRNKQLHKPNGGGGRFG